MKGSLDRRPDPADGLRNVDEVDREPFREVRGVSSSRLVSRVEAESISAVVCS
jgi:hypothetical protein